MDKSNIVPVAVLYGKKEEILETKDVVGLEDTVNTENNGGPEVDAEVGDLSHLKLVIVGQLVQSVAVHTTLFHAQLVHDGAHQGLGPLTKVLLFPSLLSR